jgi:hypothetical protein
MSDEKRRDARVATKQKLWAEGQSEMETRDISRNGMFIMADAAREVGEQFTVSFEGDEGKIELSAEVMWRGGKGEDNKVGMGVRIVAFSQGEDAYDRFVLAHIGDSEAPRGPRGTEPPGRGDE